MYWLVQFVAFLTRIFNKIWPRNTIQQTKFGEWVLTNISFYKNDQLRSLNWISNEELSEKQIQQIKNTISDIQEELDLQVVLTTICDQKKQTIDLTDVFNKTNLKVHVLNMKTVVNYLYHLGILNPNEHRYCTLDVLTWDLYKTQDSFYEYSYSSFQKHP